MGGIGSTRTWRLLNKEDEELEEVIYSSADNTGHVCVGSLHMEVINEQFLKQSYRAQGTFRG